MQTSFHQIQNDSISSFQRGSGVSIGKQTAIRWVKMFHQSYVKDTHIRFPVLSPHVAVKSKFSLGGKHVNIVIL